MVGQVSFPELMQFPTIMESNSSGIGDFKALFALLNDEPIDFDALQGDATLGAHCTRTAHCTLSTRHATNTLH